MSNLLERIQNDILDPSVELSTILLEAKALAHQLKNERFKQWVKYELDGYPDGAEDFPDYRVIETDLRANIEGMRSSARNIPIGISGTPDWFKEVARTIRFGGGIKSVEEIARGGGMVDFPWPAEWIGVWERTSGSRGAFQQVIGVSRPVPAQMFAQIALCVRSRLQDFVLELSVTWNIGKNLPPAESIERLVTVNIYNQNTEGTMSTFDQRGQNVQSQNNAAGDVNITGGININTAPELKESLSDLRTLLSEVEPEQQEEMANAIAVLEQASQDESVSRGQIVGATESLAQVPTMREKLEGLVTNVGGSLIATAVIQGIRFALGI